MKALLIPGDGVVDIVDLPLPQPGPGEVVIQIRRSGICGTDLRFLEETREQAAGRARFVPGHEAAGVIAQVGPGVVARKVGERVIGYHHIGCGDCHYCRADIPTQCATKTVTGRTRHGSNAEYLLLPEWAAFPLPDRFSFSEGVLLACNVSTAFSALRKANVGPLTTVAIFGQGVVGLSATMLATAMGARVASVDLSPKRLAMASEFGADITLNPLDSDVEATLKHWGGGRGVDVVIECSGNGKAVQQALNVLGPQGSLIFVGGGSNFQLTSNTLLGPELNLRGSSVYRPSELDDLIELITTKNLSISRLIEREFEFSAAADAYALAQKQETAKLLFRWSD